MYWCALGPPARTFRRGLGIATLQPVSSPAAGFTTNPLLGLWESAVAQVLNRDRQRATAATQQRCYVQAAAVGSFTSIYACGSRIRARCSRHPSFYSACRRRPHRPAWSGSMLPVTAESSVCPTFSRTKLGRSAVLLVSPGWALMASSSISILRCRATAGSSGRRCVLLAHCWNIHNSRAGASTSWSFSSRCRQVHLRAMGCVEHRVGAT